MPNAHNREFHPDTDVGKRSQDRLDASGDRKTAAVLFAGFRCMHQTDKISRSMCGDLARSRMDHPTNPFPEGQKLMDFFHKGAVHFSFGSRFEKLHPEASQRHFNMTVLKPGDNVEGGSEEDEEEEERSAAGV